MKLGLLGFLVLASGIATAPGADAATLAYPSAASPIFLIDHPDDWEIKQASEQGDYADLHSPKGTTIQVRTFPGTEADLARAMEDGLTFAKENFNDVTIIDVVTSDLNGMQAQLTMMQAVDKEGVPKNLSMLFLAVEDETIAEIWIAAPQDDDELDAFKAVLASFRTP